MPDIIIVGGGVTGVSTAFQLAREGHRVTLLEANRLAAMASSWTLGGVRQSGRDQAELPLARAAVERWLELDRELDAETGYRQLGNLRLARTPSEVEHIRALVEDQKQLGLSLEYLPDNKAVRALAPSIGPGVLAASWCASDGHADPVSTVTAFADAARRHGAVIREGCRVTGLRTHGSRITGVDTEQGTMLADRIVLAAGIHVPELINRLGLQLPMTVRYVCVVQSDPAPDMLAPVLGTANADIAGRQENNGRLRVTTGIGAWPHANSWSLQRLKPGMREIAQLVDRFIQMVPAFSDLKLSTTWGGLIDLTPDGLPVLDAGSGIEGLILATGFSGHGFGIAPVTGEIIADLTLDRESRFDLRPFQVERLAGRDDDATTSSLTLQG